MLGLHGFSWPEYLLPTKNGREAEIQRRQSDMTDDGFLSTPRWRRAIIRSAVCDSLEEDQVDSEMGWISYFTGDHGKDMVSLVL